MLEICGRSTTTEKGTELLREFPLSFETWTLIVVKVPKPHTPSSGQMSMFSATNKALTMCLPAMTQRSLSELKKSLPVTLICLMLARL